MKYTPQPYEPIALRPWTYRRDEDGCEVRAVDLSNGDVVWFSDFPPPHLQCRTGRVSAAKFEKYHTKVMSDKPTPEQFAIAVRVMRRVADVTQEVSADQAEDGLDNSKTEKEADALWAVAKYLESVK